MNFWENIDYNQSYLYTNNLSYPNFMQSIYITKSFDKQNNKDLYYLRAYANNNHDLIDQGYLYFTINLKNKESKYIGTYVNPKYRNLGIGSLLLATWIQLCLNNNLEYLCANRKQRKPFLLYLLKTFKFELDNPSLYLTHSKTIYICQNYFNNEKALLFKNNKEKEVFQNCKLFKMDNYLILDSLDNSAQIIDQIIPVLVYKAHDNEATFKHALKIFNQH